MTMAESRYLGESDGTQTVRAALSGDARVKREPRPKGTSVWLDAETLALVRTAARKRGVTPSTLVRAVLDPPPFAVSPAMRDAVVLVKIADALRAGDVERAREICRNAMRALAKEHGAAVGADPRSWDGT
jgi:hypothetical protein